MITRGIIVIITSNQTSNQSKKIAVLLILPILGFFFNDYVFFGFSSEFYYLAAIRIFLLFVVGFEIAHLGKIEKHQVYDHFVFWSTLSLIIGGGIINMTRPDNFMLHSIVAIMSLFVLDLVVPFRFLLQSFLAALLVIGEILIIIFFTNITEITITYTIIFSLIAAFIIAGLSSRQFHFYRRKTYEEFVHRQALQNSLQQHADNLSQLVEERTKELFEAQSRFLKSERLAAIGELAGMVGHDLRNPLSGIKNASYMLRKKQSNNLDTVGNEMLSIIDRSVEHANRIVSDLLDYSRELHLELEEYSPKSLIDYLLLSTKVPNNVKILDRTHSFPPIWVDAGKNERVFVNLASNAIEAMPNGGVLEISSSQNDENIEFTFADTGEGITAEVLAKIFTPLFTTKAQGMGFGLAICKRITEAHGGKISVKSIINKGTIFTVSLPIKPKQLESQNGKS